MWERRKCRWVKFNDIYCFSEIQSAITLHALAHIYNLICMQLIVKLQEFTADLELWSHFHFSNFIYFRLEHIKWWKPRKISKKTNTQKMDHKCNNRIKNR